MSDASRRRRRANASSNPFRRERSALPDHHGYENGGGGHRPTLPENHGYHNGNSGGYHPTLPENFGYRDGAAGHEPTLPQNHGSVFSS
ncbi:MAG: hypothetical protein K2W82_17045 [Candidatus Obscuribacterales bacterium]|nr:hypothetical protein [Candidatus Obscuribacterales bacterium]